MVFLVFLSDYALALEAEVRNLQQKFKTLEEQLEGVSEPPKMSSGTVDLYPDACISTETPGEGLCYLHAVSHCLLEN